MGQPSDVHLAKPMDAPSPTIEHGAMLATSATVWPVPLSCHVQDRPQVLLPLADSSPVHTQAPRSGHRRAATHATDAWRTALLWLLTKVSMADRPAASV